MTSRALWVWLAQACRPGSAVWGQLRSMGQTPERLFAADREQLAPLLGRKRTVLEALCRKDLAPAEEILSVCAAGGISVIPFDDPAYPDCLRRIDAPPAVLYVRGAADLAHLPFSVGVVGTRAATDYGRTQAFALADKLARAGAAVISGLALGIDAVAHAAALAAGGVTVAVIACGVDRVYPACHLRLAEAVCKQGALVSEYPPGTMPERYRFPERNRIISALSSAVVVVEGAENSGALITARYAMEQGKATYAFPGRADDKTSAAPFAVYRAGGRMLLCAEDLLADFPREAAGLTPPASASKPPEDPKAVIARLGVCSVGDRPTSVRSAPGTTATDTPERPPCEDDMSAPDLSGLSSQALALLYAIPADGSCLPDELAELADPATLGRLLTMLEISGMIGRLPSGRICRTVSLP